MLGLVRFEVVDSFNAVLFTDEFGFEDTSADYSQIAKRALEMIRKSGEWRAHTLSVKCGDKLLASATMRELLENYNR